MTDASQTAPQPRPSRLPLYIIGMLAVVGLVFGVQRYRYGLTHISTDNAQVDGHIVVISPKTQAFVDRVVVDNDQKVNVGDTLVVLDDRDLKVRLMQAEADLRSAEATLGNRSRTGQVQAQLKATEASAAGAQASIAAAEATFRKAAADLERYRGLAAQKIVSAQQLDQAQWAYDNAAGNLEAAKKASLSWTSQVSASDATVRIAYARLASAEAATETAKLALANAYLIAPASGTIAKRTIEPGALVQVGQNLMSIVPTEQLWITANLKETQLEKIRPGNEVEFSVDAYPGVKFRGKVESLSPATGARFALLPPDNATGNFTKVVQRLPVRIAVDGKDSTHPLRPGMSVDVTILTS